MLRSGWNKPTRFVHPTLYLHRRGSERVGLGEPPKGAWGGGWPPSYLLAQAMEQKRLERLNL